MQLNLTTDYAIRIVLYLAMCGTSATSKELSQGLGIPSGYVLKITGRLAEAGLVSASPGVYGGIALGREAGTISLLDIIQVMENTIKVNRCLEADHDCSRHATEECPVRKVYLTIQEQMERTLSSITIRSLMEGELSAGGTETDKVTGERM